MVNFGFSAFLKIICLNDRPQATEIRKRLTPNSGGYDFHKQMRRLAGRYLVDDEPLATLQELAAAITNPAESRYAIAALDKLQVWKAEARGELSDAQPAIYESPDHLFRVRFEPTFARRLAEKLVAIEVWNTVRPPLLAGPTYAALSLIADAYERQGSAVNDVGVLSLQEPVRLYRLSDVPRQTALAATLVRRVEDVIRNPTPPRRPGREDRPRP